MTDIGRHREVGLNLISEAPGVKKRVRNRSMAGTHIVRFISGIWQMHVLGEGNTRTTVESLIKHLRSFGFEVNNECSEKHSWFLRNTLGRSQYEKIPECMHRTFEPLEQFMNFAVFGIPAGLRNRSLHIRWNEPFRQNDVSGDAKHPNDVLETQMSFSERLLLKEMAVMRLIASDSKISIVPIISKTGLSKRTVDRIVAALQDKGILTLEGAMNNAMWARNSIKL